MTSGVDLPGELIAGKWFRNIDSPSDRVLAQRPLLAELFSFEGPLNAGFNDKDIAIRWGRDPDGNAYVEVSVDTVVFRDRAFEAQKVGFVKSGTVAEIRNKLLARVPVNLDDDFPGKLDEALTDLFITAAGPLEFGPRLPQIYYRIFVSDQPSQIHIQLRYDLEHGETIDISSGIKGVLSATGRNPDRVAVLERISRFRDGAIKKPTNDDPVFEMECLVKNELGLHTRPSSDLVNALKNLADAGLIAQVDLIILKKGGNRLYYNDPPVISAVSMLSVFTEAIPQDSVLKFRMTFAPEHLEKWRFVMARLLNIKDKDETEDVFTNLDDSQSVIADMDKLTAEQRLAVHDALKEWRARPDGEPKEGGDPAYEEGELFLHDKVLVAFEEDRPIGVYAVDIDRPWIEAVGRKVNIDPQFAGRGVEAGLVTRMVEYFRDQHFERFLLSPDRLEDRIGLERYDPRQLSDHLQSRFGRAQAETDMFVPVPDVERFRIRNLKLPTGNDPVLKGTYRIGNKLGLHWRPATPLVKSLIALRDKGVLRGARMIKKDGTSCDAFSAMEVFTFALSIGTEFDLELTFEPGRADEWRDILWRFESLLDLDEPVFQTPKDAHQAQHLSGEGASGFFFRQMCGLLNIMKSVPGKARMRALRKLTQIQSDHLRDPRMIDGNAMGPEEMIIRHLAEDALEPYLKQIAVFATNHSWNRYWLLEQILHNAVSLENSEVRKRSLFILDTLKNDDRGWSDLKVALLMLRSRGSRDARVGAKIQEILNVISRPIPSDLRGDEAQSSADHSETTGGIDMNTSVMALEPLGDRSLWALPADPGQWDPAGITGIVPVIRSVISLKDPVLFLKTP